MTPRVLPRQSVTEHGLVLEPQPAIQATHQDYYGNPTTFITIEGAHRELSVAAKSVVEVTPPPPPNPSATPAWEAVRDTVRQALAPSADSLEFVFPSPLVPSRSEHAGFASPSFPAGRPVLEAAQDLMLRINREFKFDPRATTVVTPLAQVFQQKRGVCQDFAHLQIAALRSLGLPARYVSGYLETVAPPGKPKLVGADSSHAWLQVWCGDVGWVDLDPTNGVIPADRHVTVAWGRDYGDVSPARWVLVGSGSHQLAVAVDVTLLK